LAADQVTLDTLTVIRRDRYNYLPLVGASSATP